MLRSPDAALLELSLLGPAVGISDVTLPGTSASGIDVTPGAVVLVVGFILWGSHQAAAVISQSIPARIGSYGSYLEIEATELSQEKESLSWVASQT